MLRILESGPADERVIVAEHLAHWNGRAARRTLANPLQPREVRLAAIRGANRFGWVEIVKDDADFERTMEKMMRDGDFVISHAASKVWLGAPSAKRN